VVSSHARPLPDAFAPYELVRELGARPAGVYVVRQPAAPGAKSQLMVAEPFAGLAKNADGKETDFVREARRIATLASPNLTRVRNIVLRGADVVVYSELLDGEKLTEMWRPGGLPLEIALRAIIDVLIGLGALHDLRDSQQRTMKLAHGEISPATVAFGLDGGVRVLHAIARRAPGARPDPASVGYMAPEVHAGEGYDQRADVFGVGALLWEVLSGRALFTEKDPAPIVARVRAGPLPRASVPDKAPWAKGLVDVAARALAASPDDRWPTAGAMAAELRKAAGLKLASASTATAFAKSAMAERSKARRQQLEIMPAVTQAAPAAQAALPERAPVPVHVDTLRPAALPTERDIPVAPATGAQDRDVVELGSDALTDASNSIPPQAPSGGFTLDPVAVAAKLARDAGTLPEFPAAPPVPAPVIGEPIVDAEGPLIRGAPVLAAAIAAPAQAAPSPAKEALPPPAREPLETAPSVVRQASADRPRRVLVGVGAVAALILVLGLALLALHEHKARETPAPAASAALVAPQTAPSAPPPPPPASTAAEPSSLPAAVSSAVSTPAPPPAVSPRPTPIAPAPAARPPAPPPAPPPKKAKPAFDPNSL